MQYPVSDILRCVDYINDPKKKIYKSSNEVHVLDNSLTTMKKEVKEKEKTKPLVLKEGDVLPETEKIIKEAESTISQTSLESSTVQPFQIDEIIKVDDLKVDKKETAEDILMLSEEVSDEYSSEQKKFKQTRFRRN